MKSISRALIKNQCGRIDIATIRQLFSSTKDLEYRKRFRVKVWDHIKIIPIEEVELIYSEYKGSYLHSLEGRTYLLDTSLDTIEKELEPKHFFIVSRKYIVPLVAIKDIIVYSNSRLKINLKSYNKEEVIVSRERVGDFRTWLG